MDADDQEYVRDRARQAAGQGALRQLRREVDAHGRDEAARRRLLNILYAAAALGLALLLFMIYRMTR